MEEKLCPYCGKPMKKVLMEEVLSCSFPLEDFDEEFQSELHYKEERWECSDCLATNENYDSVKVEGGYSEHDEIQSLLENRVEFIKLHPEYRTKIEKESFKVTV